MCGSAPVFTVGRYLYYRRGEPLSLSHLGVFHERSGYLHDTFVVRPALGDRRPLAQRLALTLVFSPTWMRSMRA
jgi:hypothetical protein